jgi:hypothetical protein
MVAGEAIWLDRYRRAELRADVRFEVGRFIVRPRAAAGWGESLPAGALFTLGGAQGFPGLRVGERRGDQVALAALAVLRRVRGPVYVRAEVGAGRTALARPRDAELLAGAASGAIAGSEIGLTADTPLGPFTIGYGLAGTGRPVLRVRLGS